MIISKTRRHIVSTRILNPSLKAEAYSRGIDIDDTDFLKIEYLNNPFLHNQLAQREVPFIFTSLHAIRAFLALGLENSLTEKIQCFCLSGKSEVFLNENNFEIIGKAINASLLSEVIINSNYKEVLHLTANIKREELYERLATAKIHIKSIEVYRKELLGIRKDNYDATIFLSPSQIDAFLLKNKLEKDTPSFCIGTTTAAYLKSLQHQNIITATAPSEQNILEQIYKYYNH